MNGSRSLLIRADRAVTLDAPAVGPAGGVVDQAAVLVEGDEIAAVGPAARIEAPSHAETIDLPGVTLLPGLINAHCHLDYTGLRGELPAGGSFMKWAWAIISAKRRLRRGDYEASVRSGLDELIRTGTTTVFEVSSSYAIVRAARETPMRIAFFGEVIGLNPFAAGQRIRQFRHAVADATSENIIAHGMAPHAVYSISRRLMKLIGRELGRRPMPITVHLLESLDEPKLNPWFDPRHAVAVLDRRGLVNESLLGVHVNYPDDNDVAILAGRGAYVVHCPGSHRFFGYDPFPAERLREAGVPICLGTDSAASNERLDMLREVRLFLDAHPAFTPDEALHMATTVPGRFLGFDGRLGVLKAGALADLIAVPTPPCPVEQTCASVVRHDGEVPWVMIGGAVVRRP
jgi:cytosine/adenosine deaminase-related metal-dependent hydrolase